MDEIRDYCQQARDLREQAAELSRSGRTDSQVGAEKRQLLDQAEQLEMLADQKDGYPRLEALRYIEDLQRDASALRCVSPSTAGAGGSKGRSGGNGSASR